jgi:AraC-like DNA-binding protein
MKKRIPILSVIAGMATVFFVVLRKKATAILKLNRELNKKMDESSQKLFQSEELYQHLFNNMLHGFVFCKVIFDRGSVIDYVYISVNDAYKSITGLFEINGRRVSEIIPELRFSNPEYFQAITRVVLTRKPEKVDLHVKSLNRWFSISLYSPSEGYFVSLVDNISDEKKAEEDLLENQKRLENQNLQLRDIAWMQSHEVRGPLARMMGIINLMTYPSATEKEVGDKELMEHLKISAFELDEVIHKIVRKTEAITP